MSTEKKNVPAPAATGNEDNEQHIPSSTPVLVYLPRRDDDTRDHHGTWGGSKLPKDDFLAVLVPLRVAQEIYAYGPRLIELNPECVEAQSAAARAAREKDRRSRLKRQRDIAVSGAESDIAFSVELLDALGTDQWTDQLEQEARELLEEILDRDVTEVTAELLTDVRRVRRQQRDARLAELARLEEGL